MVSVDGRHEQKMRSCMTGSSPWQYDVAKKKAESRSVGSCRPLSPDIATLSATTNVAVSRYETIRALGAILKVVTCDFHRRNLSVSDVRT